VSALAAKILLMTIKPALGIYEETGTVSYFISHTTNKGLSCRQSEKECCPQDGGGGTTNPQAGQHHI